MMEIGCIGTDYKQRPISEIERFYFAQDGLAGFLAEIKKAHRAITEIVPLLTCNRLEYYVVSEFLDDAIEWIYREIASRKEQPLEDVRQALPRYSAPEIVTHLFNVASGLESMVFGENEILAQVKASYSYGKERGLTGPLLNKLFQSAVRCGKRVRSETKISQGAYSVSSIAIDAIKMHHLDYFSRRILVLGAGIMGRRCLKKCHAMGHPDLTVVNRSIDAAQSLASELNCDVRPFETLSEYISDYDIVISAISRKQPLIIPSYFDEKRSKTSLIIDLGLPRNVHPESQSDYRRVIPVEGLKDLAEKNVKRRKGEVTVAKRIISDEQSKFQHWMSYKREVIA